MIFLISYGVNICNVDGAMKANEPLQGMLEGHVDSSLALTSTQPEIVRNAALLHYLSTLASSRAMGDTFDFQFVKSLLDSGADVNTTDVNGQTILHEVARSWQTDVAVFLFQNGELSLISAIVVVVWNCVYYLCFY